jgi:hypothetical protein
MLHNVSALMETLFPFSGGNLFLPDNALSSCKSPAVSIVTSLVLEKAGGVRHSQGWLRFDFLG